MAYFSLNEDFQGLGSSCGGQCKCGPCSQRNLGSATLAEWYELEDDEPEPAPTTKSPSQPTIGGVMYQRRVNGLGSTNVPIALANYPNYLAQRPIPGLGIYPAFGELPIIGSLRCRIPELPRPIDLPLLPVLTAVVAANVAASTAIAIPPRFENRLLAYSASNPADGAILRMGYMRCPRYRNGGPILRLQPHAKAMTLDKYVFVDGALDIGTYIHEMVHVAQYGMLGVGPFLGSYFGLSGLTILSRWLRGAPINMMRSSPHENQAYDIASRFMRWFSANP
jgi:hypothetical protein